ncbi:MAG: nucleotidyltransferase domain-containing protein [Kineosporiaceae bacterium]
MTSPATPAEVLRRRRNEREALLDRARRFADDLDTGLDVRAVVVFGSVARGDFHEASDVDVLVIADGMPSRPLDRLAALGVPPSRVEVVAWTHEEWRRAVIMGDPVALEAARTGVWVQGTLSDLDHGPV